MTEPEPQLGGHPPPPPPADTATPPAGDVDVELAQAERAADARVELGDVDEPVDVGAPRAADPLLDSERGADELGEPGPVSGDHAAGVHVEQRIYRSGEKVRSLIDRVFEGPPAPDVATRTAVKAVKWCHRLGWTDAVTALFPPLDDSDQWDAWLAFGVGIALNLVSDDVRVEIDQAYAAGAELLQRVYDEEG